MSNFSENLSNKDILKSVSNSVILYNNMNGGGTYYGRYFILGNLLIQFSDFSNDNITGSSTQTSFTMFYPTAYDTTPYCVILTPMKKENQNFPCNITLISFNQTSFNFHISTNNGEVSFFVIGPRPSSL